MLRCSLMNYESYKEEPCLNCCKWHLKSENNLFFLYYYNVKDTIFAIAFCMNSEILCKSSSFMFYFITKNLKTISCRKVDRYWLCRSITSHWRHHYQYNRSPTSSREYCQWCWKNLPIIINIVYFESWTLLTDGLWANLKVWTVM